MLRVPVPALIHIPLLSTQYHREYIDREMLESELDSWLVGLPTPSKEQSGPSGPCWRKYQVCGCGPLVGWSGSCCRVLDVKDGDGLFVPAYNTVPPWLLADYLELRRTTKISFHSALSKSSQESVYIMSVTVVVVDLEGDQSERCCCRR